HIKPDQQGRESGIVRKEAALDVSNVALVSPTTGEAVRVGFDTVLNADGKPQKVRVVHKTGEQLDAV
ncbi:MAG TPA: 50S ribosomal protein L24, partial [Myxococcales bacterium]|nr:50S ribosomal protein L24 [Myxococcales bacterium]